ncbi:MAG: 16S rRNA (cytidine(1402)-2'-O)-methyltransferase [Saprospiraceae bacterium]|nr:16S rRNA (cytidine(1402)-2'-O)-methyltransferase [Saprospiraceae bacterium]
MLYAVPTPIGNLEDITVRAIRILKEVDLILAEDTRVSKKLLSRYEISTPIESFHSHNEHARLESKITQLKEGQKIAIISDAGTPGISDPGYLLIRECVREKIPVTCLPGPVAMIPAIVMSGIPCDKFYFEGFLPHKKGKQTRIKYLLNLDSPFILYESPHRVLKTLEKISDFCEKDRNVCVCREISKIHEESIRGTLSTVIEEIKLRKTLKGEIVIVVDRESRK